MKKLKINLIQNFIYKYISNNYYYKVNLTNNGRNF